MRDLAGSRSVRVSLGVALVLLSACAGSQFRAARSEDTASAYHRFLVDHGSSKYADEARQRLELVKLRSQPTRDAYAAFTKRWPSSPLLPEVRAVVEEPMFVRTRAAGTANAYRAFLEEFPDGAHAARARGNLAYLEADGFAGRPAELAAFAREHPASDFAAEAERTAEDVAARGRTAFHEVALALEMTASTPEPERLARVFTERASESLAGIGVRVVPDGSKDAPARLVIRHHEGQAQRQVDGAGVAELGYVAETTLTLSVDGAAPIWERTTRFRPPAPPASRNASLILAHGAQLYWSSFFVPIANWNTREAVRTPLALGAPAVALETQGGHAFVLLADGGFRAFDLADPEKPWLLYEYRRPRDLKRFENLRVFGDRVVVFGEDGAEVVGLGAAAPERLRAYERGAFGTIASVEAIGGRLVAASRRGLLVLPESEGKGPEVLVDRAIVGLVALGDRMVFSDGRSVYVTTLPLMRQGRVEAQLDLAPGVNATGLRHTGSLVALLSDRGALWLDVSQPSRPRVVGRVDQTRAGTLLDVAALGNRVFTLGQRGLQVVNPREGRALEAADVVARSRIATLGRHLVLVGGEWLQVVDATPFLEQPPAAAAATDGSVVAEPTGWDALPHDEDLWAAPVER